MDSRNGTYFETEIYIDDEGLQTIMDRLIVDERPKMVWITGGKVAVLWNPTEANFVTTFPAPPPAPELHIRDILEAIIRKLTASRHKNNRGAAISYLNLLTRPEQLGAVRDWLAGEPVPNEVYPRLLRVAKDMAGDGVPLDLSMYDRLKALATEAESRL